MIQYLAHGSFVPLEWAGVCRIFIAALFGALLGLERSLAGKHAGMRTYALVATGSALFTIVGTISSYEMSFFAGINPVQIASSVVVGIGFIGAGLAAFRGGEHPGELTTAAGVWVSAAIGMACGFGLYLIAFATLVISVAILSLLMHVESAAQKKYGIQNLSQGQ